MEEWQQQHLDSLVDPQELGRVFKLDDGELGKVAERYPLRITRHSLQLIDGVDNPVAQQFFPSVAELGDGSVSGRGDGRGQGDGQFIDPLNEEALSPVPHLVHRYPHRVLLLVSGSCFSYCRFCTRKRKVGCADMAVSFGDVLRGIDYIARHPQVNEVILSGGDPLTMSDRLLEDILQRLSKIEHVEVIRLGSRAPVVLPARITPALCELLRNYQPLYFLTHFNHPDELCPEAIAACRLLVDAGIPLVNQTVLLRGINDDAAILQRLFYQLHRLCIRPYYLHQMDLTRGTAHFRTRIEDGIAIMDKLRGPLSGLAVPTYIVDLPGGHGKIPVTPDYIQVLGAQAKLRAADGTLVDYPQYF